MYTDTERHCCCKSYAHELMRVKGWVGQQTGQSTLYFRGIYTHILLYPAMTLFGRSVILRGQRIPHPRLGNFEDSPP